MANEGAPSSNLMMENVRLQAKLNTPEGLRAGYTASLEVVGVTMALAMGFAFDSMGDRPEVADKSVWGDEYLDQADLGVDIYLGFLGVTFALSFTCLFVSAGVYASLNQTPDNCTAEFFKEVGIWRMQSIHVPQTYAFFFFGMSGALRISLVANLYVTVLVWICCFVFSQLGLWVFKATVRARNASLRKLKNRHVDNQGAEQERDNTQETAFSGGRQKKHLF
eukprot:m.229238 g.229238  ORF g.229238 m.229238 type:complete len:222 (-) comp15677_c1_seq7:99-764(-)